MGGGEREEERLEKPGCLGQRLPGSCPLPQVTSLSILGMSSPPTSPPAKSHYKPPYNSGGSAERQRVIPLGPQMKLRTAPRGHHPTAAKKRGGATAFTTLFSRQKVPPLGSGLSKHGCSGCLSPSFLNNCTGQEKSLVALRKLMVHRPGLHFHRETH